MQGLGQARFLATVTQQQNAEAVTRLLPSDSQTDAGEFSAHGTQIHIYCMYTHSHTRDELHRFPFYVQDCVIRL